MARRWGIAPPELESRLSDPMWQRWVRRALVFMRLEGQAETVQRSG